PATPAGSFTWLNDRVVQWNPKGYWPAHSNIIVTAGGAKTTFETGAATMGVADIDGQAQAPDADRIIRSTAETGQRDHGFADDRHSTQRPRGVPAHSRRRCACHVGRRLCALRPVVSCLAR